MPSYSRLPAGTVYVSTAAAAATAVVAADSLSVQVPRPRHSEVYDGQAKLKGVISQSSQDSFLV